MAHDRKEQTPTGVEYQSLAGCLPRIVWLGVGNIALILAALMIYKSAGWTIADLVFGIVVAVLIGTRYVDIVRYRGTTADGQPATMTHFRRYVIALLGTAMALWVMMRALGPGFP